MIRSDVSVSARVALHKLRHDFGVSYWKLSRNTRNAISWNDQPFKEFGGEVWLSDDVWVPNDQVSSCDRSIISAKFKIKQTLYLYLSGTVLVGRDACPLLPNKKLIAIPKRSASKFFHEEPGLDMERRKVIHLSPKAKLVDSPFLTLSLVNRFDCNYGHWMCELLPQTNLLLEKSLTYGYRPRVLVRPDAPSFVCESLSTFFPTVTVDYYIPGLEMDNLLIVQNPTTGFSYLPSAVDLVRRSIIEYLETCGTPHGGGRKFYLSRSSTGWRRVANESELVSRLSGNGIESVNPGHLSFQDQIKLFSQADFLVGMHGSAFINMLFCHKCTSLELVGNYGDVHMASLSAILNFRHKWTRCHSIGVDIHADVNRVIKDVDYFIN